MKRYFLLMMIFSNVSYYIVWDQKIFFAENYVNRNSLRFTHDKTATSWNVV